jgi:hypothetical protein
VNVKVRVQPDGLGEAETTDHLRSVVIYDDFDQPVLVAQKLDTGQILVSRCGEADFNRVLRSLGIGLNASCRTTVSNARSMRWASSATSRMPVLGTTNRARVVPVIHGLAQA